MQAIFQEKEEKVQKLVKDFAKKDPESIRQFLEIYSDEIYNFPIRFYNFSEDDAGDFYLFAFEHLRDGKKLASYQGKSRFNTWFFAVLRNLTIDFLRSRKEKLKTTSIMRLDSRGNLVDAIDSIVEENPADNGEEELFKKFEEQLSQLKYPQRVLFKLAYINFLDLSSDEILWLAEINNQTPDVILKRVMEIKDLALEKASEVRKLEDKLTANFQIIQALEGKIVSAFKDNPDWPLDRDKWTEDYNHQLIDPETIKLIQTISKKRKKQIGLLEQQRKSLPSVRVPYKSLVDLLGSSKGVLSVQLMRVVEKLSQGIETE